MYNAVCGPAAAGRREGGHQSHLESVTPWSGLPEQSHVMPGDCSRTNGPSHEASTWARPLFHQNSGMMWALATNEAGHCSLVTCGDLCPVSPVMTISMTSGQWPVCATNRKLEWFLQLSLHCLHATALNCVTKHQAPGGRREDGEAASWFNRSAVSFLFIGYRITHLMIIILLNLEHLVTYDGWSMVNVIVRQPTWPTIALSWSGLHWILTHQHQQQRAMCNVLIDQVIIYIYIYPHSDLQHPTPSVLSWSLPKRNTGGEAFLNF